MRPNTEQAERNHDGPLISIVIAVYNGGTDLERCLAGVEAQDYGNHECILVDDASTDGAPALLAQSRDLKLITLPDQHGPAYARNKGAEDARGEILFFTDADVVLHPDALSVAAGVLEQSEKIAAVFGSYDDEPGHSGYLSQYRNLLHHWVHQTSNREAFSFWSGCGAVRKRVFDQLGGFNPDYANPSIEDIEFGYRIKQAGQSIRLEKSIQGKHLKHWRFVPMVKTDIFRRAIPWMELILRDGKFPVDMNLDNGSRLATVTAGLLTLLMGWLLLSGQVTALLPVLAIFIVTSALSLLSPEKLQRTTGHGIRLCFAVLLASVLYMAYSNPLALWPLVLLGIMVLARRDFYRLLRRKRGFVFAVAAIPMQFVHFLGCAIAVPLGLLKHLGISRSIRRRRADVS